MRLTGFELTNTARDAVPAEDAAWIPAVVPGGVHESLLAAGLIAHPYFGDNEASVAWVEDQVWWYRTTFPRPEGGPVRLELDGVDTVCEVRLNGAVVGTHANQHRPFEADVTALLQDDNALLLRFTPPLDDVLTPEQEEAAIAQALARHESTRPGAEAPPREQLLLPARRGRRRKASLSWGWDFAPRVPSVGLLRGATLRRTGVAEILSVGFTTVAVEDSRATVRVHVETAGTADTVRVSLTGPDGSVTAGESDGDVTLVVEHAQLWWTNDLGEQPLYALSVSLLRDGEVVATESRRVGIRTLELDQSQDGDGRLFRFVLNGVPLFARGANWVPASMLPGSVADDTYRSLAQLARDAGMNMVRMWGGGVYEPAAWFEACDELGILVWQDFMFAGAEYHTRDGAFVAEVAEEARFQVRRLGHHPSLGLWCGENEVQALREIAGMPIEPGDWGWSIWNETLPAVVAEHAPGALYWPGSPWGTQGTLNGVLDGDRHAWEVWHGLDVGAGGPSEFSSRGEAVHFRRYTYDHGRFISEFGIHASPEISTLERWTPPGSLALRSEAFDQRNKDTPKDKGWALMEHETGAPTDLQSYVDFSMACQAEGLKLGIEHYRRRQPHCSGTLVWQLNDAWPGFSWSVIDYDLVPKAAYWFLQRVYRPVIATFAQVDSGIELWVTNSSVHDQELDLQVQLGFSSDIAGSVSVTSRALSSEPVWSSASVPDVARVVGPSLETNRAFFRPLKELPIAAAPVSAVRDGDLVRLRASSYSYLVRVHSTDPTTRYDGNYLDLAAGEERVIRVLSGSGELSVASYGFGPVPV